MVALPLKAFDVVDHAFVRLVIDDVLNYGVFVEVAICELIMVLV